jgi:hypothetical protein
MTRHPHKEIQSNLSLTEPQLRLCGHVSAVWTRAEMSEFEGGHQALRPNSFLRMRQWQTNGACSRRPEGKGSGVAIVRCASCSAAHRSKIIYRPFAAVS